MPEGTYRTMADRRPNTQTIPEIRARVSISRPGLDYALQSAPPLGSSKTRFEEGSGAFFQHAFEEGWKFCLIVLPALMWPPTPVRPPRPAMPAMSIMISPGWAGHASLAWRLAWPGPAALPAQASMAGTGRRSKPEVLRHTVGNSGKSVS